MTTTNFTGFKQQQRALHKLSEHKTCKDKYHLLSKGVFAPPSSQKRSCRHVTDVCSARSLQETSESSDSNRNDNYIAQIRVGEEFQAVIPEYLGPYQSNSNYQESRESQPQPREVRLLMEHRTYKDRDHLLSKGVFAHPTSLKRKRL